MINFRLLILDLVSGDEGIKEPNQKRNTNKCFVMKEDVNKRMVKINVFEKSLIEPKSN